VKPTLKDRKAGNRDIIIPASAAATANFFDHGKVTVKIMDNMIVLNKSDMTTNEMVDATARHLRLAKELLGVIVEKASEELGDPYAAFGKESRPLIDACDMCEMADFCEDDIYLPPCMLKKAGMPVDADLELTFCEGGILITEAGEDGDSDE